MLVVERPQTLIPRLCASLALLLSIVAAAPASAQPEPTFFSSCDALRDAIGLHADDLQADFGSIINVEGEIVRVGTDGVLYYVVICSAPAPEVTCVTYGDNGNVPGDRVEVSGRFSPIDADTIFLDPCLHDEPAEA